MKEHSFDLLIIGAGSAGVRCARVASQLGAKVGIVENRYFGGTCVNVGCVPKKLFVYASLFRDQCEAARGFGWSVDPGEHDWNILRDSKTDEIQRLNRVYESILVNCGAEVVKGEARIIGPNSVAVGEREFQCRNIVIATGGWPRKPEYPGGELTIDSNEVFYLDRLPGKVLVEGGGYIALEFASIFNGLGCDVEVVYRGPCFLRGFDPDLCAFLAEQMREKGIEITFNTDISQVKQIARERLQVDFADGSQGEYGMVFSAIGRRPMTDNLGLEALGIETRHSGAIVINDQFQTNVPSIYALGDVVGRMPLTPVALREGTALARHLFAKEPVRVDYSKIATAVFCQPEVATIGLTEEQARKLCGEIEIYKTNFKPMKHSLSGMPERSFMKLVVRQSDQRVVGCHMVGENAAEIMQGIAIAINMGATKRDFDDTVGIHPTAAEEWVTMTKKQ